VSTAGGNDNYNNYYNYHYYYYYYYYHFYDDARRHANLFKGLY